ncbi:MAG: serine carboxypeptidase, partial [Pseudomonadota bacterium]|nr:serine carboxypeptidase [Pseudomonadota bacterium]
MQTKSVLISILSMMLSPALHGADETVADGASPIPEPTRFISEHSARFNGQRIDYTATAGETYIRGLKGEPKATLFTFAYTKTNLAENETRPVTFVWNGGPGSASTWLHMGSYGP